MDIEFNWLVDSTVLYRLVLAILLGGVVGIEREMHGLPPDFARISWSAWERP